MPRIDAGLLVVCTVLWPLAAACGGAPESPVAVSDSAGVLRVEIAEIPSTPVWRAVPELSIGGDPDRADARFGFVADVSADPSGHVYVLDQHASRVRVFDPAGRAVRTIGAPGEGPGEIGRFAWSVVVAGDTVAVADWGRALLHRFRSDGTFIDAVRVPFEPGVRSWWRSRRGGGYLVRALARLTDEAGRWRGRDALLHVSAEGWTVDTLVRFAYAESDLGSPGDARIPLIVNAPAWAELSGGRIAWTDLADPAIRVHGPDGALEGVIRHAGWTGRPLAEDERRTLVQALREKIVGLGGSASALDEAPLVWPDALPAVTGLAGGPDGTIWVQRMGDVGLVHPSALNTPDPPLGYGGGRWEVLDGSGRPLGVVDLPPGFRVYRIDGRTVLGVRRNVVDEEIVQRLRLEEGSR